MAAAQTPGLWQTLLARTLTMAGVGLLAVPLAAVVGDPTPTGLTMSARWGRKATMWPIRWKCVLCARSTLRGS